MAQYKRPPRKRINGLILLNKHAGDSSNGVLQKVIRLFNAQKGGHTGALDPFATGLLPICLGEATKISGLLLDSDKRYTATLKLGERSDTGDTEGEIVETRPVPELTAERLETAFESFRGAIEQVPPMYSALKHQGKPLYHYARKGIEIERPARPVTIYELELLSFSPEQIVFEVLCSKGTYVRTLGEDIAEALGTVGHLTALHRTQTGSLKGDAMLTLDEIESQGLTCLQPMDLAVQHLQRMDLDAQQSDLIRHGQMLDLPKSETELVRLYDDQGEFFAIGEWHEQKARLKPKRVFNLEESYTASAKNASNGENHAF